MSKWEELPESRRESLINAVSKYRKENYDRISLNVPKGTKDLWHKEALERGFPALTPFIISCVQNCINKSDNSDNSIADSD